MTEVLEFAKDLVKCRSVTPNNDGVMQLLEDFLRSAGFDVEVFECSDPNGWNVNNLYASFKKGDGPNLAFAGHLDVVPVGDILNWSSNPFEPTVMDGKLYGRGVADMKSAVAAFAVAVKEFVMHNDFSGTISFLITGDEEEGSPQGMRSIINWCIKNGKMPDYCIIGEPTCSEKFGDSINVGRRGSINFKVISNGEQGHVAYPEFAKNSINPMISFLNTILSKKWDDGNEDFEPTKLEITSITVDNDVTNIIPGRSEATFNVRFNNNYTADSLTSIFKDMAALISADIEVQAFPSGEPFKTDDECFVSLLRESILEVIGIEAVLTTKGATSDGRFLIKYCPVIEFGLRYNSIHKENEFVEVDDIDRLKDVYYVFLKKFFKVV